MKVLALLLCCGALAACESGDGDYQIQPGGSTPPGTGTSPDAPLAGDAGVGTVTGRVCLVTDLRAGATCATAGAGDISVTLGTSVALTDATGAFTIDAPTGTDLVWRASGTDLVTSVMPRGIGTQIPVIDVVTYADLLLGAGVLQTPEQGSIIGHVRRLGAPLAGAVAEVTPVPAYPVGYDGATGAVWRSDATGARGTLWVPAVDAGAASVTVTPTVSTVVTRTVAVEAASITFVTIDIP